MKKLTIHEQVAKRDAEENPQPKKRGFARKEHHYLFGKEATEEEWRKHLSTFGTPNYTGPIIKADGKTVMVKDGKEISNITEEPKA